VLAAVGSSHFQPENVLIALHMSFISGAALLSKEAIGVPISSLYIYIYIYIYMCVCVCVCVCM